MSKTKECPFCHQDILVGEYKSHLDIHTTAKEDGQMQDHISLKEAERYTGSLEDIPQVYVHNKCGGHTVMPEFIIRTYLVDPTIYNNYTFCCGCQAYVHTSELVWCDTGETLISYNNKLLKIYFKKHPWRVIKAKLRNWLIDMLQFE